MIYVILSAEIINKDPSNLGLILKIGYCRDDREKVRTATYLTENPTIKTLFTIPGGTEQDEKNLHHHFRKYLKYGNEWFSYNQEILDFFTTHTTKESLGELDLHLSQKKKLKAKQEKNTWLLNNINKYINPILNSLESINKLDYIRKQEELVNKLNSLEINEIDNYFKTAYPDISFEIDDYNIELSSEAKKIIKKFNKINGFNNKMRYLYSLSMSSVLAVQVFNNIQDTNYSKYYWTIPANRAGTLGYIKKNLEIEYNSINREDVEKIPQKIKEKILELFTVNSRYSKADAKNILKNIYDSLGYNKSPKANDLEQYFELKECKVLNNDTGKRDHGFEIIKIKGGDQDL